MTPLQNLPEADISETGGREIPPDTANYVNLLTNLDRTLFHLINGAWTNPVFDRAMPALSRMGNLGAVWFALLAGMAAFGKRTGRRIALAGFVAFAIGFTGAEVMKEFFMRPRPFAVLPDARLLIPAPPSFAFPSGHTTSSFAVASAAVISARRLLGKVPLWGWLMLVLAAAISYSRVYVGVHWPADVAVGVLFGAFSGWLGARSGEMLRRVGRGDQYGHDDTGAAPPPVEYAMSGSHREEP